MIYLTKTIKQFLNLKVYFVINIHVQMINIHVQMINIHVQMINIRNI
jgi:hypothetical protein